MTTDKTTKSDNQKILQPPVEDVYGFFGTVQTNSYSEATGRNSIDQIAAGKLWALACRLVAERFQCDDPAVIRNFLRSKHGRHLADDATCAGNGCDEYNVAIGIGRSLDRRRRNGESIWKKPFEDVRKATVNGEFVD